MKLNFGFVLGVSLFFGISAMNAQDYGSNPDKCKTDLSIFYEYAKVGNYAQAYEPWKWCMDNCPAASKNLYKYGLKMLEDKFDKASTPAEKDQIAAEIDKVYEMRIQYYPDNLGKVYSDWANSIYKRAKVSGKPDGTYKPAIYDKLSKSFKADPSGMSVKNLGIYFQEYTDKNKNSNPQGVFDTYDEITEAVGDKMDSYSKDLDALNKKEASGQKLSSKEKSKKRAREVNLTALSQVEGYLDNTLSEIATCDRLIPLYKSNFPKHKTDAQWLKRAVSRLNAKDCTEDPLYPEMVEAFVNSAPSSDAYVFYAGILLDKGDNNKALEYFDKAVTIETDPYKKARIYYRTANIMKQKGQKSKSRDLAYKALKERPSMGSAYLLIANLYASSANSCGDDEFSKRMVYVAAVEKARKAKAVDPGITATANKYIKSYGASAPSKKLVFTEGKASGSPFKVGCWIGETVSIP